MISQQLIHGFVLILNNESRRGGFFYAVTPNKTEYFETGKKLIFWTYCPTHNPFRTVVKNAIAKKDVDGIIYEPGVTRH